VNNLTTDVKIVSAREVNETFHARYDATGKTYLYRISVAGPESEPDIFMRDYRYQLTAHEAMYANASGRVSGDCPDDPESPPSSFIDGAENLSGNYLDGPEDSSSNFIDGTGELSSIYLDGNCTTSPLSVPLMREAAAALIGKHDFSSFRSAGGNPHADPVKTLTDIAIRSFESADTRGRPITEYEIRIAGDAFLYNMVRILVGTLVETGTGKRTPQDMAATRAAKDRRAAGHTAPAAGLWLEKVHFGSGEASEEKESETRENMR
jgi:tRNA pseudouridine(38-40) synthase